MIRKWPVSAQAGLLILTTSLYMFLSCSDAGEEKGHNGDRSSARFELLSPDHTGVRFTNTMVSNSDVEFTYEYRFNGAGVAVGDLNNDGLDDLFFTATNLEEQLYLNKGQLRFENITEKAGIVPQPGMSSGVTMVDINCDGYLDIYVCRTGKFDDDIRANLLYINNGDLTFTESAAEYGLDDKSYSNQSTFFDMDNDGDLDMYLVNQPIEYTYANTILLFNDTNRYLVSDRLYRNNGDGSFTEITANAGVDNNAFGFNAAAGDFNDDGFWDLYVTNDYLQPDYLYINNGNGTFTESLSEYMKHCPNSSMGSVLADYNNDGFTDVFVLDMMAEDNHRQKLLRGPMDHDDFYLSASNGAYYQYMRNQLQLNNGNGTFSEIGEMAGISNTDWSWGPLVADLDNDGWKDLFVANGYRRDMTNMDYVAYFLDSLNKVGGIGVFSSMADMLNSLPETPVRNYAFRNNRDLTFTDVSMEWGFSEKTFSNGAVYADLDNDGDLEVVINNIDQNAMIYKNNTSEEDSSFIQIVLEGDGCNTKGVGSRVFLYSGEQVQLHTYFPTQGYYSSLSNMLHFGLGDAGKADSIEVIWPDNRRQVFRDVTSGSRIRANRSEARQVPFVDATGPDPIFVELIKSNGLDFIHRENDFVDFKREPLLPMKFSETGPALSTADVNRDGLTDVYIGGASGQAGVLYIQNSSGVFRKMKNVAFEADKDFEDTGCLFFDADNDGDADLYVTSGGNEWDYGTPAYQDRLYLNNGTGLFTRMVNALPRIDFSTSCVTAADVDKDGDQDLFVGGRVISWNYPLSPRSYLLLNQGGTFVDVTPQAAPDLQYPGMVCDAEWTDFNSDGLYDLVIAGQWMPVTFFRNTGSGLVKHESSSLIHTGGWWNSVAEGDFDRDGDIDYIFGNRGLNSRIKASPSEPARVYAADFDGNRTMDAVMTYYIQGTSYPIHDRDQISDQVRPLKKRFLRYRDYADATIYDVFPPEKVDSSLILEAHTFASSYVENLGNGSFKVRPLPLPAQVSAINDIIVNDWDMDGNLDVLYAGNDFSPEVVTGRYDASIGGLLRGNGDGTFTFIHNRDHGFKADGHVRKLAYINDPGRVMVIVVRNNDKLMSFKYHPPAN